jgi:hypothetical protein
MGTVQRFTNRRAYHRGGLSTFRAICVSIRAALEEPNTKQDRLGYGIPNEVSVYTSGIQPFLFAYPHI